EGDVIPPALLARNRLADVLEIFVLCLAESVVAAEYRDRCLLVAVPKVAQDDMLRMAKTFLEDELTFGCRNHDIEAGSVHDPHFAVGTDAADLELIDVIADGINLAEIFHAPQVVALRV